MVLHKVGMLLLKLIIYNIIKEKHTLENLIKDILYCADSQNIMQKISCDHHSRKKVLLQF